MNKTLVTLGYVCLIMIGLYLLFGLLKISGNGLGSVIEGMTDDEKRARNEEKHQKEIEKLKDAIADVKEKVAEEDERMSKAHDLIDEFDNDLLDIIRMKKKQLSTAILSFMLQSIEKKKDLVVKGGKKDMFTQMYEQYEFLERMIKNPEGDDSGSDSGSGSKLF